MFLSLVDLLEEKSFNSITVDNILRNSRISRGTFYRYVSDKKSLLIFGVSHYINEVIMEMGLPDPDNRESLKRIIELFISTLEKRERIFRIVLGPNAPPSVEKYISKRINHYLKFCIYRNVPGDSYFFSRNYLSIMTTNVIIGMLKEWPTLSKVQKEKMTDYFHHFSRDGLTGLISNDPSNF